MFNIFEYPFVGIGIAVLSMIALWLYHIFCPAKKRWWHFTIPFLIAGLAFAVAFFVQTDKEKIQAAIYTGIRAFEKQDIKPIGEIIADDYTDAAHGLKELMIAYCQAFFQTEAVEKVTTFSRETKINDRQGTYTAEMMVKFAENSEIARMGKDFLIVKARFHFKKIPQGKWVIYSSEILELDRKTVSWNQLAD